jgi:hypothetical protein
MDGLSVSIIARDGTNKFYVEFSIAFIPRGLSFIVPRAPRLHRTASLPLPGHPVTTAVMTIMIK